MLINFLHSLILFGLGFCWVWFVWQVRILITTFRFYMLISYLIVAIRDNTYEYNNFSRINTRICLRWNECLVWKNFWSDQIFSKDMSINYTIFKFCNRSFQIWVGSNIQKVLYSLAKKVFSSIFVVEQILILEILLNKTRKFGAKIGMIAIYKLIFIKYYIGREAS